jgi:hypothetical protein
MRAFAPESVVIGCCDCTRGLLGALMALVLLAVLAPAHAAIAAPPSADAAAAAFLRARAWLDAGQVPAAAPDPDGVAAAAAILRLNGRILGTGKALAADPAVGRAPGAPGTPAKPTARGTVARAVAAALDAATAEVPVKAQDGLGARLTLELEVASAPEPLIGRTFIEVAKAFEPAEAGLAMRHGDRWSYQPAATMIARRLAATPSGPILAMVGDLQLPPRDLADLQDAGSTAVYAVRGLRLAQAAPDATPFVVARTLPVRSGGELSRADAASLAGAIVARLADQLKLPAPGEGVTPEMLAALARVGLRGDYSVAGDAYDPAYAGAADQALCAWALARAAGTEGWPESLRSQARATSCAVLRALADVDQGEDDPAKDHAAAALALLALDALRTGDGACDTALETRAATAVTQALAPAQLAVERPHVAAALVAAAAVRERAGTPLVPRAALEQALAAQWDRTSPAQLVGNGAFLLLAERALAADEAALAVCLAPRRATIDATLKVLLGTQQRPLAAEAPATLADGVGAFPVTGVPAGRASSQSARAQLFVALAAAMPGVDPARTAGAAQALRAGSRFLAQLTASSEIGAFAPQPASAQGGVLASAVELTQPLAAQAMAIWALAESDRAQAVLDGGRPR